MYLYYADFIFIVIAKEYYSVLVQETFRPKAGCFRSVESAGFDPQVPLNATRRSCCPDPRVALSRGSCPDPVLKLFIAS